MHLGPTAAAEYVDPRRYASDRWGRGHGWHGFRLTRAITTEPEKLSDDARLLETLQQLAKLPGLELRAALTAAATLVSEALRCEKVDAFLFDEAHNTLRALGTSETPMGRRQKELGLDVLALSNGGRSAWVFTSGNSYLEHHAERDPEELRGIVEDLGVRSTANVAFEVNGVRRGVLSAVSASPGFFQPRDLKFLEIVSRWVGMLAYRSELADHSREAETEHARRKGADEIITVLAHDLRNHLHPLIARLHVMQLSLDKGNPVSPSLVEGAMKSVQRLSRLTEDLLDLKRLDEGLFSLRLAPVDLSLVIHETAASIGTSATPVQVKGEPSLIAVIDEERIRQALENLVSNAIKYSPRDKPVEVQVSTGQLGDSLCAVIEVLDSGPGISPEVISTLFERFSFSSDSKGLGLGLYLAHRIARVHSGELSAHARSSGGTRFRLTLPLHPPEIDSNE